MAELLSANKTQCVHAGFDTVHRWNVNWNRGSPERYCQCGEWEQYRTDGLALAWAPAEPDQPNRIYPGTEEWL